MDTSNIMKTLRNSLGRKVCITIVPGHWASRNLLTCRVIEIDEIKGGHVKVRYLRYSDGLGDDVLSVTQLPIEKIESISLNYSECSGRSNGGHSYKRSGRCKYCGN